MTEYFSHDYNARNDIKLKKLFMKEGLQGIGLYWCLVEMLYEKGGRVELEYIPIIAFDLRTEEDLIKRVISDYELFERDDIFFYSPSILKRLQVRQEKSEKAKNSANARWNKCDSNANALQTDSDSNAIIKEKENKININNNIKEKGEEKKSSTPFEEEFNYFVETYGINVDNYSAVITQMDFKALANIYSENEFLRTNFISLSRICKEYQRILGGYYKKFEKPKPKTTEELKMEEIYKKYPKLKDFEN